MVNYYIYAKDYSGSTNSVWHYHKNGLSTLEQFKSDVNKIQSTLPGEKSQIVYLHWGHECKKVSETETRTAYHNHDGDGCDTLPETIIEWIKENIDGNDKIKLMYIITDGLIYSQSFNRCLELNENMNYEKVVFHALNEELSCIDLSVTASFIKSRCKIYRNNELFDETDISKEYDYDRITPNNFATEKENLKSYIKFKFLTTPKTDARALVEIDKLKHLKNRLNKVSTKYFPDTMDKDTFIRRFKDTNWYKSLSYQSYDLKVDIEKSITTLINYIVSEKKSYGFDALKFENTFSNEVPDEPIEDIKFTADQEIEFPDIILDDEKGIPVILCTHLNLLDKLIFQNPDSKASFTKFISTMECPLFLLQDPDINESLGYFYTLTVYKQLIQQETKLEPRTRRPFHGGLVLVDTADFDAYNDYILSATYFDFKKVKFNIGLFYFVLWKICEKKQWMDKNVVAQFKKYTLRRISTTKCKIGLSSLPLDPQLNASLPSALWYCVELSTLIFKDNPKLFAHERLRMYHGVAHLMTEILINLNYKLDLETINKRKDIIKHVMILKRIPTQQEKVLYLVERIFKKVNGFLIPEIKYQANVKKLNYLKLNHKEMLRDNVVTKKVYLEEYVHFLHHSGDAEVHICDKTFRPFFMIDKDVSFYSELYKIATQVVVNYTEKTIELTYDPITHLQFNNILSPYNLYLNYVKKYKKFPTLAELKEYVLKKKKFKDDLVTIFPENVHSAIERVFVAYESVIKGVSVEDFVKVSDKFVNRLDRIRGEERVKFESYDEIEEFLTKEERKVNLNLPPRPGTGWTVVRYKRSRPKSKKVLANPPCSVGKVSRGRSSFLKRNVKSTKRTRQN